MNRPTPSTSSTRQSGFAWRIYRRLAQAFPHEFKLAYGADVMQLGEDVIDEIAKRHGAAGLVRLIADIAIRVPLEYLSEMRGDMRYAMRALLKSPGFALVGIISMGLGIGLTTNVYSSKWAMLFRDLPGAANAKDLVMMQQSADSDLAAVSYYYIEQFREQKSLFTGVAAFETGFRGVNRDARRQAHQRQELLGIALMQHVVGELRS